MGVLVSAPCACGEIAGMIGTLRTATGTHRLTACAAQNDCGIHVSVSPHICGPICPPCESCASRPRMRLNDRGELEEGKP